ncbi:hypothetical protein Hanom_Chr12g01164671 [Helianthus anomalus]
MMLNKHRIKDKDPTQLLILILLAQFLKKSLLYPQIQKLLLPHRKLAHRILILTSTSTLNRLTRIQKARVASGSRQEAPVRRVVVLEQDAALKEAQISSPEQDAALKEAQISSLQAQISSRDQKIDQLQGDLGMLMSVVYDLKSKLKKRFGNEFIDKEDEQFNVGRPEQTIEERVAARAAADAEHEVGLNAYLADKSKKKKRSLERNRIINKC